MYKLRQIKKHIVSLIVALLFFTMIAPVLAQTNNADETVIDRVSLVTQQISLLKNRLSQAQLELNKLQKNNDQISQMALNRASKNIVDKASLDISVAKSNLDSLNIELADSQQNSNWLEKNIQEIENQLNVLGVFRLKLAPNETAHINEYRADLTYQRKLLQLEKIRTKYLQEILDIANTILSLKKEKYNQINALLKSRKMVHVKQQQVKDELAYQEQQNKWLGQLNVLYARLAKVDPAKSKSDYAAIERDIFYANESANYAYVQSLIARYKDQIQQMKLTVLKSNSISLLNEIGNQVQTVAKQISRLEAVLGSRISVLEQHINFLSTRKSSNKPFQVYIQKLKQLQVQYKASDTALVALNQNLTDFRKTLDQALQSELSSRQGLPIFSLKMLLDLGKEILLLPALTFQVVKSLSTHLINAFQSATMMAWVLFGIIEVILIAVVSFLRKQLSRLLEHKSQWRERLNSQWLSLQCLKRNFIDLAVIGNAIGIMYFLDIPQQNYMFVIYLSLVWLAFKSIMTISRICLIETTHDTTGHDVRLYRRLKWIILIGCIITAFTVFIHQLPLIYELKTLFDRLFLFLLMIVSLLLLRSWDVVPNLILSHIESKHPYLQKSIRLFGILVPILLFGNSVIGLIGFVNLVMTVSWYEGIFLFVLIGYLVLRGLLSDAMEHTSRLMIQYVNNGWLWTEAFLKPIDKVLRITLFLIAWAVLFLLYGWDKQSPIVERLTRLLNYQLSSVVPTITPLSIIELFVVISVFYWTAKWTREFVYRLLFSRTQDMGIRNSIAILSQYCVVVLAVFICLKVLGIDLRALTFVSGMFAFGIGLGLRDLANNFVTGFLLLFERPIRVGDIINVNEVEGEVTHIGSRAVTIRTWDHMELVVPNSEFFSKSFINWTANDNIIRSIVHIKISRFDNPHAIKVIIQNILANHKEILKDPIPVVYLKEINDTVMDFELRYYINIRQVLSRVSVMSSVLLAIWDAFAQHGIKPPYPLHEILLKNDIPTINLSLPPTSTNEN